MIKCTDDTNALGNALPKDIGDIGDMEDVVENIEALQEKIDNVRDRLSLHAKAQTKRNIRYEHQIKQLDDCMRSNAFDIANIIDKIDEMEDSMLKLSKYTKDFIHECRIVIQDLDRDIRKLL